MSVHRTAGVRGHAFLSYVRRDRQRADRLQNVLEAAGIPVWRDTSDLPPGADWKLEITEAITAGSLAFVACFSENSNSRAKTFQNEELILAVEQMRIRPPGAVWLLPVRFADCDIPPFDLGAGRTLRSLQQVDLFDDQWEPGAARLIAALYRILSTATYGEPREPSPLAAAMSAQPPDPGVTMPQPGLRSPEASGPGVGEPLAQARSELERQIALGRALARTEITRLDQILDSPSHEAGWGSPAWGPAGSPELEALTSRVSQWRHHNQTWLARHLGSAAADEYRRASRHKAPAADDPAAQLLFLRSDLDSEVRSLESIHARLTQWLQDH